MATYTLNKLWINKNGILKEVSKINGKKLYRVHYNNNTYTKIASNEEEWDNVLTSIAANTYTTDYHIGDLLPLTLGAEGTVDMEIVAFQMDEMAASEGKSHITFISKQPLRNNHSMNDTNINTDGWKGSEIRKYLQSTIKPLFPENIKKAIKKVKKYSYSIKDGETNQLSEDELWIPSSQEVNVKIPQETAGIIYSEMFTDNNSRIKYKKGENEPTQWWLRSTGHEIAPPAFLNITQNGSAFNNRADLELGVVLGFCL